MADSKESIYGSAAGFIQFDIDEREYNGGVIRDATIRSFQSGDLLRVSIWPDFADVEFSKGDVLFVDGKVDIRKVDVDGESRTYVNMNARKLAVLRSEEPSSDSAPAVVKKDTAGRKTF